MLYAVVWPIVRILASVYRYICVSPSLGGKAHVQNGVSVVTWMRAVFKLVVQCLAHVCMAYLSSVEFLQAL